MFQYHEKDNFIPAIHAKVNMDAYLLNCSYRVYGVWQGSETKQTPHIVIGRGSNVSAELIDRVTRCLTNSGLTVGNPRDFLMPETDSQVTIGLRLDVRENTALSAAIIKMIVCAAERQLANGDNLGHSKIVFTLNPNPASPAKKTRQARSQVTTS